MTTGWDVDAEYARSKAAIDHMEASTGADLSAERERLETARALMGGAPAEPELSGKSELAEAIAETSDDARRVLDVEYIFDDGLTESPTVLHVGKWGMRRGAEIAEQWKEHEIAEHAPEIVADAHSALFEPAPKLAERPAEAQRAAWWKALLESKEYRTLHGQTCLDPAMSELAAKSICDQWVAYVAKHPEPKPEDIECGKCPLPGSDSESLKDAMERMKSVAAALKEARETVSDARDLAGGLGMGDASSGPLDPVQLTKLFRRVRDDRFLRQLMQIAGRMRTLAQALQRTKTVHGQDDTVGVELGGDIARLIPSELTQLTCGIPEVELLALDRVARRQALCRKYRAFERLGRGPIVVVVDESGSMHGKPVMHAKALALALGWIARQQQRWIAFVGFSGNTGYNRIAFAPGKIDQAKLIEWLVHFFGGGSDRDLPIKELPEDWPALKLEGLPDGKTDVIMITDDVVHCPIKMRDQYRAWARAEQVTTYGIALGRTSGGALPEICDRYWQVTDLELTSEAVEGVLSI